MSRSEAWPASQVTRPRNKTVCSSSSACSGEPSSQIFAGRYGAICKSKTRNRAIEREREIEGGGSMEGGRAGEKRNPKDRYKLINWYEASPKKKSL